MTPRQRAVRRRRARAGRMAIFVGLLGLLLAACTRNLPQDTLDPAGPVAERQLELFTLVFWIAVAVFVIVEGLLVFAMIRFRHRPGREPRQIHGNTRLEVAWTIVPAVLLAAVAVPTVATVFDLAREPENALQVTVTGHQWWWEVEYPDEQIVTANEVHVPTDRPVYLTLTSEDVIHSFWVPRLAGKQDLIPGHTENLSFSAPEPGTYRGTCAEYCGLSHANMRFRVIAQEPSDYEAWVQDQTQQAQPATEGLAAEGYDFIQRSACIGCHTIDGIEGATGDIGPDLTHLADRQTFAAGLFEVNEENLRRWVADAPAMKPGSRMPAGIRELGLTEDQVEAVVAYLLTLE